MTKSILAVDAATEACSVALYHQGQMAHRFELCPQKHSQRILPMVDEVLKEVGVTLAALDVIAFGHGPGSFTGVRIGVGVAQGLAFGADLPMVGISTLQTMAQSAVRLHGAEQIVAAIDARMGEVYAAEFCLKDGNLCRLGEEIVVKPEDIEFSLAGQVHTVGTGWQTYADTLTAKLSGAVATEVPYPDALDMLPLAQSAVAQGLQVSAEQAQPVYVRDTVTWKKLPGR